MPDDNPSGGPERSDFRKTLLRVLLVQVVALVFLAVLQIRYHG